MDYLDELRTILNEINVGGKDIPDDDDGQDFVDDGGDDNAQQQTQDTGTDDTSDEDAGEDFMDDDGDDSNTDGSDQSTDDQTTTDDGTDDDGGEDFMDNDDDSSTDAGDDTSGEGDDDEGGEDFMSDDDSGEGSDGEEGSDDGEEGTDDDNGDDEGSDYDIDKIEDELFSSLTPEQIAIKNHELKENFTDLYSIIGSTLVRINDIAKTNDNINILKFITEKLIELREMIDFNITTAYQTRTYIENNIIYQQCIATLNAISQIIDQIPNLDGKKSDTIEDKEEQEKDGYPVEPEDDTGNNSLEISDTSTTISTEESYDYSSDYNSLF